MGARLLAQITPTEPWGRPMNSRYDRPDPGVDPDYCAGLSEEREERPTVLVAPLSSERALHALLMAITDVLPLIEHDHRTRIATEGMAYLESVTAAIRMDEQEIAPCPF